MKLVRLLAIGVFSFSLAPGAFATLLHGTISTSGVGTLSATGMRFRIPGATNLNPGAGHFDQSKGAVVLGVADFSIFDTSATMFYVPAASSTVVNGSGKYTGRALANLKFSGAAAPALANPVLFEVISQGGVTLDIYLTGITHFTVGSSTATGAFSGIGYAVEVGNPGSKTDGTFYLTDFGPGAGEQTFSAEFFGAAVAPEPSSLALLGTGVLAAAGGLARRKLKA